MKKDLSLYVHIPFCLSKCRYCNFVSCVAPDEIKVKYLKALNNELVFRSREYRMRYDVSTIYIGGGTPSSLRLGSIKSIMNTIYSNFSVKNGAEITIEINPNDITDAKIEEFLSIGINRFSIGLQTSNESILKILGRTHNVLTYQIAVSKLKNRGATNISTDIILGLPGQTEKDVKETLKILLDLKVPHISAYMLQVEDGTPLKKYIDEKIVTLPSEDATASFYEIVCSTLKEHGYDHYEVSNFAFPGFASKHNKVYWNGGDYLGAGASAHSLISPYRMANTENIREYINIVQDRKMPPIAKVEKLDNEKMKEEMIMLSLRTKEGLNTVEYEKKFKENFIAKKKSEIALLLKNGFIVLDSEFNIKVTEKGMLVLNEVIRQLT